MKLNGSIIFASWRQCAPHLITLPWTHPHPQPKRHLDRFSRFYRAHDWQIHKQTDRPRYSICNNKPHLCWTAMQPNNIPRFCAASSASRFRINSCAFSFFSRASRAAFSFAVSAGLSTPSSSSQHCIRVCSQYKRLGVITLSTEQELNTQNTIAAKVLLDHTFQQHTFTHLRTVLMYMEGLLELCSNYSYRPSSIQSMTHRGCSGNRCRVTRLRIIIIIIIDTFIKRHKCLGYRGAESIALTCLVNAARYINKRSNCNWTSWTMQSISHQDSDHALTLCYQKYRAQVFSKCNQLFFIHPIILVFS